MHVVRIVVVLLVAAALSGPAAHAQGSEPAQPTQPVVVTVDEGGFEWRDAALGAVAGAAVSVLLFAAVLAVRHPAERTD